MIIPTGSGSDKLDDVTDKITVWHLFLYLLHDIKDGCLTMEQQTIGIGNMLQRFLVDTMLTTYLHVHATILHFLSNDIRRDIL